MLLRIIKNWWRNLRVRNQILIFQSIIISIIFALSSYLLITLIDKLQSCIENEVLETTIIKSIISNTNILIVENHYLGMVQFQKSLLFTNSLANLYEFQIANNIKTKQQVENCLQSQHSSQFYKYQFCSGIYGSITESTNLEQIKTFISLQNQIIPFDQLNIYKQFYNIQLDETQYFSQYQGEYLIELKQEIKEAIIAFQSQNLSIFRKQIKSDSGQLIMVFQRIPGTQIAFGNLQNISEFQSIKAAQQITQVNQRVIGVLFNGFIISDSQDDSYGQYFQNVSISGFNHSQFDKIVNFTLKSNSIQNECEKSFQDKYLCLINVQGEEKIIFPFKLFADGISYIIIVITDTVQINTIRSLSYEKLQSLRQRQIDLLLMLLASSLVACLVFQLLLILLLNRPLKKLERLAIYHVNNNQHRFLRLIYHNNDKNYLEQLNDAFHNLIYITDKVHKKSYKSFHKFYLEYSVGKLQKRSTQQIVGKILQQISQSLKNQ